MSWFDEAKKLAAATVLVMENTDQATAEMRMGICLTCDKMDHEKIRCTVCGCYLQGKTWSKVSRSKNRPLGEVTHCPLGKWQDMEIANFYRQQDGLPLLHDGPTPPPDGPELEDHFFF